MTLEPRYLELMHAEIDGVNSERESSELRVFLASNPEAQAQLAQLRTLASVLARLEEADPPADIKINVLNAVRSRKTRGETRRLQRLWSAWPSGRVVLRYGYAAAAGLLLGIAAGRWAATGPAGGRGIDPSELAGTMTRLESTSASHVIGQVDLDLPGIKGTARVRPSEAGFTVEFDVDSRGPVRVVLGYDPAALGFRGFAQDLEAVQGLEAANEKIAWTQSGHHRSAVVLTPRTKMASRIDLRFFASGSMVQSRTITVPGGG